MKRGGFDPCWPWRCRHALAGARDVSSCEIWRPLIAACPVVELGEVAVVGWAQQADVLGAVIAAHAVGASVMELEPVPLGAASALLVDEAATLGVARAHGAAHGCRDVARWPGAVAVRDRLAGSGLAGSGCLGEAPGLEPFELLGDGSLDDRGDVAVGDFGAHEGREPLELVVQLGAGSELDLVAPGRERLDDRPA